MTKPGFRLPDDTHRVTVIGKTGSGKTLGSLWQLSQRDLHKKPWVIFDFKRDKTIGQIPGLKHIGVEEKIPKYPGLYAVHPMPDDDENVDRLMLEAWKREKVGMYFDEAYMIDKRSSALQAILTQGRSKEIPIILCTQRPVEVSRFAVSEADFFQVYKINDKRDQKTVGEYMPNFPLSAPLPDFHSYWYDVGKDYRCVLAPVPDKDVILDLFTAAIGPKRVYI